MKKPPPSTAGTAVPLMRASNVCTGTTGRGAKGRSLKDPEVNAFDARQTVLPVPSSTTSSSKFG